MPSTSSGMPGPASARKHQQAVRRQRERGGAAEAVQRLRLGDDTAAVADDFGLTQFS